MGQIALKWTGDDSHLFVGRDSRGGTVVAGTWPRAEEEGWVDWRGAKASDLLVVSLSACSAYDVVDILKKQRLALTGLTVTADPTQAPEPPWAFTHIHLHYVATGRDLDPAKVESASSCPRTNTARWPPPFGASRRSPSISRSAARRRHSAQRRTNLVGTQELTQRRKER